MDNLLELSVSAENAAVFSAINILNGADLNPADSNICTLLQSINQNERRICELNSFHILAPYLNKINSGSSFKKIQILSKFKQRKIFFFCISNVYFIHARVTKFWHNIQFYRTLPLRRLLHLEKRGFHL